MLDPLLARAQLAALENRTLRREGKSLRDQINDARAKLRLSVFESEMQRAEFKAICEDRHWRREWPI
jgi:hypothetical protein